MKDELKTLLENEVLSEDAKASIKEAFDNRIEELKEETKKELEIEYAEKYTEKLAEHTEKLQSLVDEVVKEEVDELKEDLRYYADLEVKYAKELEQFKESYAEDLSKTAEQLIESVVKKEFKELSEDINEAKKLDLGRRLYEAFKDEYETQILNEDDESIKDKLSTLETKLKEANETVSKLEREKKLDSLLEGITGSKKNVLETILERVPTEKLEERYNEVIDSVLKEEKNEKSTESAEKSSNNEIDPNLVVLENEKESVDVKEKVETNPDLERMRKLAGIQSVN